MVAGEVASGRFCAVSGSEITTFRDGTLLAGVFVDDVLLARLYPCLRQHGLNYCCPAPLIALLRLQNDWWTANHVAAQVHPFQYRTTVDPGAHQYACAPHEIRDSAPPQFPKGKRPASHDALLRSARHSGALALEIARIELVNALEFGQPGCAGKEPGFFDLAHSYNRVANDDTTTGANRRRTK